MLLDYLSMLISGTLGVVFESCLSFNIQKKDDALLFRAPSHPSLFVVPLVKSDDMRRMLYESPICFHPADGIFTMPVDASSDPTP